MFKVNNKDIRTTSLKHLQATASLTGKMPMISGRRYFIFQPFEVSDFD